MVLNWNAFFRSGWTAKNRLHQSLFCAKIFIFTLRHWTCAPWRYAIIDCNEPAVEGLALGCTRLSYLLCVENKCGKGSAVMTQYFICQLNRIDVCLQTMTYNNANAMLKCIRRRSRRDACVRKANANKRVQRSILFAL